MNLKLHQLTFQPMRLTRMDESSSLHQYDDNTIYIVPVMSIISQINKRVALFQRFKLKKFLKFQQINFNFRWMKKFMGHMTHDCASSKALDTLTCQMTDKSNEMWISTAQKLYPSDTSSQQCSECCGLKSK